jgi:phenylalanine-4-hydroxylase
MFGRRPFYTFSDADHATWRALYERQYAAAMQHGARWYREGVARLGLTSARIPDFAAVNETLKRVTGWQLVSTDVQYTNGQDWFEALARREFLITEYIRDRADLDYTPMPDIFHDTFGHLPFMAIPRYADFIQRFALHSLDYTQQQRHSLGNLWWYTIEFGLIVEDGELKALGAGLLSSYAELRRVFDGEVEIAPFDIDAFETHEQSPHEFHERLFVVDSWEQIERAVEQWTEAHPVPVY